MAPGRVAFQYPNFRYYVTARFLVTASSEMQSVAVAWQVYRLTHRPVDLGLVGLAQFLPGVLLFLAAGQTADRVSRQRVLQSCYAGFSLVSVLLLGRDPAACRVPKRIAGHPEGVPKAFWPQVLPCRQGAPICQPHLVTGPVPSGFRHLARPPLDRRPQNPPAALEWNPREI